jgi:hypothetical protein
MLRQPTSQRAAANKIILFCVGNVNRKSKNFINIENYGIAAHAAAAPH